MSSIKQEKPCQIAIINRMRNLRDGYGRYRPSNHYFKMRAIAELNQEMKDVLRVIAESNPERLPGVSAPVDRVVEQSICPVCNKQIDDADMSSTGYIDYHKECNLDK